MRVHPLRDEARANMPSDDKDWTSVVWNMTLLSGGLHADL
jgi:hypothetical protein